MLQCHSHPCVIQFDNYLVLDLSLRSNNHCEGLLGNCLLEGWCVFHIIMALFACLISMHNQMVLGACTK